MANRVAWLTKRVKIGGQWLVRKPIIKTSGFVTEKSSTTGIPSTLREPSFWSGTRQRQRDQLSASTGEAQDALLKKTQTLEARSNGLTVVEDQLQGQGCSGRSRPQEYLEEVKLNRAHKTHLAYKRALDMLVSANPGCESCMA